MTRTQKLSRIAFMVALLGSMSLAKAQVVVSPASAQVNPGAQVQFSATGSADNVVIWSLSGSGCIGISCGEIDSNGLYTAPATAPNPPMVTVTATSLADVTQTGSAIVTIGVPKTVGVSISPASATVAQSGQQQFSASVTGTSNTAVNWTVSGAKCSGNSCGTITSGGLYTAPATLPSPAQVTVTATSVASPTKSASATVALVSEASVSVAVSPSAAQVSAGQKQQFSARVTGITNASVKWTISGAGCSGAACGSISSSGLYIAPAAVPAPPAVTITATSVGAPSKSGKATATIVAASPGLTISPANPSVKPGGMVQFSASGPDSGVVIWSASGSGCAGITCGTINSSGLYTAPGTAPSPDTVVVTAVSLSNTSISASTTVTIGSTTGPVSVVVTPSSVELNTGGQQLFKASVTGSSNTAVTWSVSGFGCAGADCGTITSGGLYTAPSTPPNPSIASVTATSVADPTKSSTATVLISEVVAVSVSPAAVQVGIGASQQFTAKVTGTAIPGVTWSVSGAGCSGSTCGTITASGVYTAPDAVPSPAQVTVTATADADGVTTGTATVTIVIPIRVTISPTTALVTIGNQQQFDATVSGPKNTAVTWSVSGAGCSGAACGTISSAGLYTAPASVPSPATVTVKATAQASASAFASATVTIAPTNNSKLNGQYAFQFTGFDSDGVYQATGTFTANGQGKITTGIEDVNDSAGPSTNLSIAGTYQVSADNRGVMTINSPVGTHTYRFALNLLGTKARFISFDSTGVRGSGVIELQDTAAFDASLIVGGYALNLTGMDSNGSRIGALGLIFPDGSGFISGASLDVNDGGVVPPTFATFSGVYSVDDATGRGTATFSIPGFDGGSFNFAFYIVSANEFLMISTDPLSFNNPIFSGPAELQSGAPFAASSFNGGSVFSASGTNGSAPDDRVGRFQFNGSNNVSMNFDENSGGNVTEGGLLTGAYDLELNGRGTLNLVDPATGATSTWFIYAFGPNDAFLMDASTGAVFVGEMKQQLTILPFSNSDILGTYIFGSGEPIKAATPVVSGIANFDGGNSVQGQGIITGTEDSQGSSLSSNIRLSGTYSVSSASNNGRGAILFTSPSGKSIAVWVTNQSEFVGLHIDSTTPDPTVLFFEQ